MDEYTVRFRTPASKTALHAALLACACLVVGSASAQRQSGPLPNGYPLRPVRVLVGGPPGSGTDVMMRVVAQKLTQRWGRTIVVDNRPGALGSIAIELTAQAAPDGYTLITLSGQNFTGMLLKTVNIDIPSVTAPVVQMMTQPYLLVVTPALPVNSVGELIVYAKSKPLVYASSGTGSVVHLGMELFKFMAGVPMVHIPYKGSGQSMVDVMSGQVQLAITNSLTAAPLVKGGKLRALAVTSLRRTQAFPDLPTISEAGVSGYELNSWYGLFAPTRTAPALILALNAEVSEVMNSAEMRERLAADGAEPSPANSPAEFKQAIAREMRKWEKFLASSGIKLD
jgi:tripartite-type tricarboxylate transporter receptor subunit TctC